MIPAVAMVVTGYAFVVLLGAGMSLLHRTGRRPGWLQAGAWTLLVLLTGQAVLAGVALARGSGPTSPGLFIAYLVVSVLLLPICGAMTVGRKSATGSDAALAIAAIVIVIVQWRLASTWRGSSA